MWIAAPKTDPDTGVTQANGGSDAQLYVEMGALLERPELLAVYG